MDKYSTAPADEPGHESMPTSHARDNGTADLDLAVEPIPAFVV
jgi:hypothetical protein